MVLSVWQILGKTFAQLWMVFLVGGAMKHRSKEGAFGEILIIFFFLQSALCFYTLEGNFHQVSLTSILKQIKSQQKNPTLGQVLAWEWWVHQPLTGLASWGHAWWGPCIRAFSCPIQIQILLLWRKSLIQITPGLQMPLCLGLPSSGLLWSRGLAECKNKD